VILFPLTLLTYIFEYGEVNLTHRRNTCIVHLEHTVVNATAVERFVTVIYRRYASSVVSSEISVYLLSAKTRISFLIVNVSKQKRGLCSMPFHKHLL